MQLGGVRSTSQVANSFMGTGLKLELEDPAPDNNPAMFKLPEPTLEDVNKVELEAETVVFEAAAPDPVKLIPLEGLPEPGPGGRNPLLTALAILLFLHYLNIIFRLSAADFQSSSST